MWRLANCVFRVFRNSSTYYYSHDVFAPCSTICSTDHDSKVEREDKDALVKKCDIQNIFKTCEFTFKNIAKLQALLKALSIQWLSKNSNHSEKVEVKQAESVVQNVQSIAPVEHKTDDTIDNSSADDDLTVQNTLQALSDLHNETMSLVKLQMAVEALESGNFKLGVETLEKCIKMKPNPAAFYNLGICYEHGLGVEKDRAKACDYYLQAANLGHIDAQYNLTLLSNQIDTNESDQETIDETPDEKPYVSLRERFFRLSLATTSSEDDSSNDHQVNLHNRTVACLT